MANRLHEALNNVDMSYQQLIEVANDITRKCTRQVDDIVSRLSNIEEYSLDDIRNGIMELAFASYSFSELKEKSSLKAEVSETLRKSAYAMKYNEAEGTATVRDSTAFIGSEDELLAEQVCTMVSNSLKTKLDEVHRVVDALKSILISRMQEAKLSVGEITEGE